MPETLKTYSIEKSELLFMFPQSRITRLSCEAYSFFILPKFHDITHILLFAFNAICCQSSPFLRYSYTLIATRCKITTTVK